LKFCRATSASSPSRPRRMNPNVGFNLGFGA
jgi:hypothetical protein